jgi:hypothetical protein
MVDYFAKPVERAKAEWTYVESANSRRLKEYISIVGGESDSKTTQKVNYAGAIINVLRGEKFPAIFSWQSYLESNFNPGVRSSKRAEGFWQFIPETRDKYFRAGERTTDPYDSTKAAVRFLTDLLKMWDSDVKMAVASYHAGQGNIEIACREGGLQSDRQSCDSTKNYMKSLNYDVDELKNLYRGLGSFWHIVDVRTRGGFGPEGRKYVLDFVSGSLISFNPQAYGYKGKAVPKN